MKKLMLVLICMLLVACSSEKKKKEAPVKKEKEVEEITSVSFAAVGDNLIHNSIYFASDIGNNQYNFNNIYEPTNYLTQEADIAYINQETIAGGVELGLSSYPTFNGPYEILDAVAGAGFDWISSSSNHSFDRGEQGIINQLNYMVKYPEIAVSGTHRNKEEAKSQVIEKNGLRIGISGYTYGLNGFELPEGKEYFVNLIDKDKIKRDITALKKVSDVQVISMHWGEEYQFQPNEEQQALAQFLSDEGVDVIIGGHPHVIQPMDYLKGKDGNDTLVIYSLGNFLSAQDVNYRMLGGMAKWTISYNRKTKEVSFQDVKFLPTITHIADNNKTYRTYALKDYSDELANQHTLRSLGEDISRSYFIDLVEKTMNDKIEIVY